jgi:hypothetical protein
LKSEEKLDDPQAQQCTRKFQIKAPTKWSVQEGPSEPLYLNMRNPNLSNDQREAVLHLLLQRVKDDGKLKKGALTELASLHNVTPQTIGRVWARYKDSLNSTGVGNVHSKRYNCGRKKSPITELHRIVSVPLNRRSTIRSLACATGIPKSTLHRRLKQGAIRRHSSSVRPMLADANKVERVRFALSYIRPNGMFQDMFDHVHIDEKWFYLSTTKRNYYLLPDEPNPDRKCQSKRFIEKVMFMAAVARPRWIATEGRWFNGLI